MLTRRESKQPVPSVIARLMGLDDIPPQQPVQKKPRVLSENYLRRVNSIGVRDKYSECHSSRSSIEEQNDCKNVLQVLETLRRSKRHVSGSKKLNEASDGYWQSGQAPVFKSPCASDSRDFGMSRKFRRKSEQGYVNSPKEIQNCHDICSSREVCIDNMNMSWRSSLKLNNKSCLTSRTVVLKPNLGKAGSAARCLSLSSQFYDTSHSGNGKKNDIPTCHSGNPIVKMKERTNMENGIRPVRRWSRFLRERTKNVGHGTTTISHREPCSEISGNGLFVKAKLEIPSSPILPYRNSQVHCSDGSSVSRAAKKQISERWKTTKKFEQVEFASGRKTQGEMLAMTNMPGKCSPSSEGGSDIGDMIADTPIGISSWGSGKKPISRSLFAYFNAVGSPNTRISHEPVESGGYLRDPKSIKWVQNKSSEEDHNQKDDAGYRSGHSFYKKPQAISNFELENSSPVGDRYLINEQETNFKKDSSSPFSVDCKASGQNNQILQDSWQAGNKNQVREEDFPEQITVFPKFSIGSDFSISTEVDVENGVLTKSSLNYNNKHQLESRKWILLAEGEDSSHILDASAQQECSDGIFEEESVSSQYYGTDPESLMSVEEAYQPSPNSVLEPLYKKGISPMSDCFKSVNTSLHGLHIQLELLKSEALEAHSDVSSMMVSSDDDSGEGSVNDSEEKEDLMRSFRVQESRDFSYLVDILAEAGFHIINLHADFKRQHSQEYAISYSVFETLEKKYGEQISWKRSERKLLFDRINSMLIEILQPSTGVLTWTKPVARRLSLSQSYETIEEELWMLLVNQEKELSKESEKYFGKDDKWLELDEDTQVIGREIENSLIDELVVDFSMDSF